MPETKDRASFLTVATRVAGLAVITFAARAMLSDAQQGEVDGGAAARARAKTVHGAARGRSAEEPHQIPWTGWKDIFVRVYKESLEDRLLAEAAGVAFYAILAIFPAVAALVSLYGLFADPNTIRGHLDAISFVLPAGALEIVGDQAMRIASKSGNQLGITFLIGFAVALWSANAGVKAMFDALNVVYEEKEKRSFIWLNIESLIFTFLSVVFVLVAMGVMVVLPVALGFIGLGSTAEVIISLVRWPILLAAVVVGLAVLYRYGPSRERARWAWVTWGSFFAAVLWVVVSVAFSWYVTNLGNYNETYGSLGAAIGFMTWLWLSVAVTLVGGEVNAEMEHQTARDSTVGAEKPMGVRGARMADTLGLPQ